jgi:hypothetical protein
MEGLPAAARFRLQDCPPLEVLAEKVADCSAFVEVDGYYQLGRSMQRLVDAEASAVEHEGCCRTSSLTSS